MTRPGSSPDGPGPRQGVKAAASYLRGRMAEILHVLAADPSSRPWLGMRDVMIEISTDAVEDGGTVHAPDLRILVDGAEAALRPETEARLAKIARACPRIGAEAEETPGSGGEPGYAGLSPIHISMMAHEAARSATARAADAANLSRPAHLEAARATCARIDIE